MKRCPQCSRTYKDDSLRFCLEDGTVLSAVNAAPAEPAATVLYSSAEPPVGGPTTNAIREAPLTRSDYADAGRSNWRRRRSDNPSNVGLIIAVIGIGLVLIVIASIGVVLLWRQTPKDQGTAQVTSNPSPNGTPGLSASPSNNNQENLQTTKGLTISATASSVRYAVQDNTYVPGNAIDGSRRTAWIEGADGQGLGEWLRFDFGREINLHRIVILPGYFKSAEIWKQNNRIASATLQFSNGTSKAVNFPDQMEKQAIDLGSVRTRWVRLEIKEIYAGSDPDTAISEVIFEWEP